MSEIPIMSAVGETGASSPPTVSPDLTAISLAGYVLERIVGRGGQGTVFQATQLSTGRRVAIKLAAGATLTDGRRRRLLREVETLASMRHRNIVGVTDQGWASDGSFFMVLDFVEGEHLDRWIQRRRAAVADASAFQHEMLLLFRRIVAAVAVAHERRCVHRDLKPANILVDQSGEPSVLDFGLSKVSDADETDRVSGSVTRVGAIVGSLPWMSPEQAAGESDRLTAASDVYSLGVMLYEALTSHSPYPTSSEVIGTLRLIREFNPEPLCQHASGISPVVESVVMKALRKSPGERFPSAVEMLAALESTLPGDSSLPRPRDLSRRPRAGAT